MAHPTTTQVDVERVSCGIDLPAVAAHDLHSLNGVHSLVLAPLFLGKASVATHCKMVGSLAQTEFASGNTLTVGVLTATAST